MYSSDSSSISNGEYEVEAIVDDRKKRYYDKKSKSYKFTTEYLIKWVGYKRRSWEPEQNLENCKEMLLKYKVNKKNLFRKNGSKTPIKSNIPKNNKNKDNISTPHKLKKNPYLAYLSDKEDDKNYNKNNNDNNYNDDDYNDDKSEISFKYNIKTKQKLKKNKIKIKNKFLKKNKEKKSKLIDLDFDIEIVDGNESPFYNKINKNEFYSESTFDPFYNLENINENSILHQNLDKKRKRSESSSNYSISIDDPIMKSENTSQNITNNSNINHIYINNNNYNNNNGFMGISQVSIPKSENV